MFKPTLYAVCCFILCLPPLSAGAALTFKPAEPLVEAGGEIDLSVEGAVEPVAWTAAKGQINARGAEATYTAPAEADIATITVRDAADQLETITVIVLPAGDMTNIHTPENTRWKVYANRSNINALLLSPDGASLWVGANGGLEKRDSVTGRLLRVYDQGDSGLPSNDVNSLADDGAGGLWVGGDNGGVARLSADGIWTAYEKQRHYYSYPGNDIKALAVDGMGGVWVGNSDSLGRLSADGSWIYFGQPYYDAVNSLVVKGAGWLWAGTHAGLVRIETDGSGTRYHAGLNWSYDTHEYEIPANSGLPSSFITSLVDDGAGGLWMGAGEDPHGDCHGLVRLGVDGNWTVYHAGRNWNSDTEQYEIPANSGLPDNCVRSLAVDGAGGLWVGAEYGGLARLGADGSWTVYDTGNSGLPSNHVKSLAVDGAGGLWAGASRGLARLGADGTWTVYNQSNDGLPSNDVISLANDGAGGVWAGVSRVYGGYGGGLARLGADGAWTVYHADYEHWDADIRGYVIDIPANSGLPNNTVRSLAGDGAGGLWMGTSGGGLARLGVDGNWTVYHAGQNFNHDTNQYDIPANSGLPANSIASLAGDGAGGLWAGTDGRGLARLDADGNWTVYHADYTHRDPETNEEVIDIPANSDLPNNRVNSLVVDGAGRLWAGAGEHLARLDADGTWTVAEAAWSFPQGNRTILSLAVDAAGRPWTGTDGYGLARLGADEIWTDEYYAAIRYWSPWANNWYWHPANSDMPSSYVRTLLVDGVDGLWAGTDGGLARLDADGIRAVYNTDNSGLPDNIVQSLADDGAGGLWAGTSSGLARLSFFDNDKLALIRQTGNSALLTDKRAAIVIHPLGPEITARDASSMAFMAAHAYRSLKVRGYSRDEIYFISAAPDMDINNDGHPDHVVDAPVKLADIKAGTPRRDLTLADLRAAFDWAAQQGALDQPLLVIFTGHGETNRLLLDAHGAALTAPELDALLDSYQENTGNQVVVMLEAGHSGAFIPVISGDNRLVITSADSERAYYDDMGALSFTRLFFDKLRDMNENRSFSKAFHEVIAEFSDADSVFRRQRPLLDDNGDGAADHLDGILADSLCLNGCIGGLSGVSSEITLTPETPAQTMTPGQKITLAARAVITNGQFRSVRAVILTPEAEALRSAHGFSLVPPVSVPLTRDPADPERWSGTFSGFTFRGNYVVKFLAEDRHGFFAAAAAVTLTLEQGPEVPVAPAANLKTLRNGNVLRVNLPFTQDEDIYAGIALPDGTLYLLDDFNSFQLPDGSFLPRWKGADTLLELSITPWMPRGEYLLYMLRLPPATEPWSNRDQWQMGVSSFTVG